MTDNTLINGARARQLLDNAAELLNRADALLEESGLVLEWGDPSSPGCPPPLAELAAELLEANTLRPDYVKTCDWCAHRGRDVHTTTRDEDDGLGARTYNECADVTACEARVIRTVTADLPQAAPILTPYGLLDDPNRIWRQWAETDLAKPRSHRYGVLDADYGVNAL